MERTLEVHPVVFEFLNEIASLEELYPLVMEQEELANVGLKNRRHQC